MKNYSIEERAINLAHYIIDSKDTVRGTAKKFGISKSTVHKDVSERLQKINPALAHEVRLILDENKAERHIRGGMATKLKYSSIKGIGKPKPLSYKNLTFFFPFAPTPSIPFLPSLNSFSISFIVIYLYLSVIATFSATIKGSKKSIKIRAGEDAKLAPAVIKASK